MVLKNSVVVLWSRGPAGRGSWLGWRCAPVRSRPPHASASHHPVFLPLWLRMLRPKHTVSNGLTIASDTLWTKNIRGFWKVCTMDLLFRPEGPKQTTSERILQGLNRVSLFLRCLELF